MFFEFKNRIPQPHRKVCGSIALIPWQNRLDCVPAHIQATFCTYPLPLRPDRVWSTFVPDQIVIQYPLDDVQPASHNTKWPSACVLTSCSFSPAIPRTILNLPDIPHREPYMPCLLPLCAPPSRTSLPRHDVS